MLAQAKGAEDQLRVYEGLDEPARTIMRMKALLGPATGKTLFLDCLTRAGLPAPEGGWIGKSVNPVLERLRGEGLLDEEYACIGDLLHPVAAEAAASGNGPAMIAAVAEVLPGLSDSRFGAVRPRGYDPRLQENDAYRRLRLCVYANDEEDFARVVALYRTHERYLLQRVDVFGRAFVGKAVGADWLVARAPWFRRMIVEGKLARLVATGEADPGLPEIMVSLRTLARSGPEAAPLWRAAAEYELLCANFAGLHDLLGDVPGEVPEALVLSLKAAARLLDADMPAAVTTYRDALRLHYKLTRKRKGLVLPGIHGLLYLITLLKAEDPTLHADIEAAVQVQIGHDLWIGFGAAQALLADARNNRTQARNILSAAMGMWADSQPMAAAFAAIAELRIDPKAARANHSRTQGLFRTIRTTLPLVAGMLAEVLERCATDPRPYRAFLSDPARSVRVRFVEVVEEKAAWQRTIAALEVALFPAGAAEATAGTAEPTRAKRLVWFVSPNGRQIEVAEQVARGAGWSSGRAVALKRLHSLDPSLDYLDEADRRVARTIRKYTGGWYGQESWDFDDTRALIALIGHPRVFDLRDRKTPIEMIAGTVELLVREDGNGLRVSLSHEAEAPTTLVAEETPNRWRVVRVDQKAVTLAATLGPKGVLVPKAGRAQVEALVRRAGPALPVRAELDGEDLEASAADVTPVVRLLPIKGDLKASLVMRPAGPRGPVAVPGQGARLLSVTVAGRPVKVQRDLDAERGAAAALIGACPTLAGGADDSHEWLVSGIAAGLELLTEIGAYPASVTVEWPQGKSLSVRGEASAAAMKASVGGSAEWFTVGGTVTVDEDLVLDLKDLLGRLDRAEGRFIPLDDGRFLALTRAFRAQLDRLRALADGKGEALRLSSLRMAVMNDLFEDAGTVKGDKRWKEFARRLKAAADWSPDVPATLQAELRDYQREGFAWMMRLARWGAGACLADDMGLGKTVQAIGVMLALASEGPCLVAAPTSVCGNWEAELARFAPSLTVHRLSDATDRAGRVSGLKAGDVLIVSYGLLAREEERLSEVDWRVAILDEAQAIKNPDTRRAQAAVKLKVGFRLVLTGTPVENRLDELWSLFAFANPGLLGGRDAFQANFAVPIERDRSPSVRQSLKALVRPFLLRRTKGAVLAELPPRTEQTLLIELSEPERALYEALRRKALERLGDLGEADAGRRRIHILTELTRLRQACCHPSLAMPEGATSDVPASKLETVLALVDELKAGGHRALVFSQFVRHLDKVRTALDDRGVTYQYLDGSTTARAREAAVSAFQGGKGDLFLISLKAGGFGLNLTAADYVLHLDPWWNPAVEDQASDRAHRIGQQRPVTIYRLVVRDSVEDRIVALHARKRDLADAILEGAEASAALSEDDLLALIRG